MAGGFNSREVIKLVTLIYGTEREREQVIYCLGIQHPNAPNCSALVDKEPNAPLLLSAMFISTICLPAATNSDSFWLQGSLDFKRQFCLIMA